MEPRLLLSIFLASLVCLFCSLTKAEDEFDRPPVSYSESKPDNPVERLQSRLDSGMESLEYERRWGYLRSALRALEVPISSQTLVFSKTSLQAHRISPKNPRALYFNDDVYVGWVPGGEVVEISVADPLLGAVFYTLEDEESERPRFLRQSDDCLICHSGPHTRGAPGHVVRSVYPEKSGQPMFSAGSYRVDDSTPFQRRWGGWYVTGSHGPSEHLGNLTYSRRPEGEGPGDKSGLNLASLEGLVDADRYLSPHSDLVALTVLAHQVSAHNVIARASFDSRCALHREAMLNRELGEPEGHRWPSTNTVLEAAAKSLVDCFLFRDEAAMPHPVSGSSGFADEFEASGRRDHKGRSLRDLDLKSRLFEHQCSFLVYSESFDAMPEELKGLFWRRMEEALSDRDFSRMSADERDALRDIIAATKPSAPESWRRTSP